MQWFFRSSIFIPNANPTASADDDDDDEMMFPHTYACTNEQQNTRFHNMRRTF